MSKKTDYISVDEALVIVKEISEDVNYGEQNMLDVLNSEEVNKSRRIN